MDKQKYCQSLPHESCSKWTKSIVLTFCASVLLWSTFFSPSWIHWNSNLGSLDSEVPLSSPTTRNVTIVDFSGRRHITPTSNPGSSYYQHRIQLKPLIPHTVAREDFNEWLQVQSTISFERVLANIGDVNLNQLHKTDQVAEGAIIASPSKQSPDYFYHWIRDGAITANTVVNKLWDLTQGPQPSVNITLVGTVLKYLNNTYVLQRTDNPSGSLNPDYRGLGEPKWMVDNQPFTGNWGRPQNDGPPLRVITTFNFLQVLQDLDLTIEQAIKLYQDATNSDLQLIFANEKELYDKIIKLDLEFVASNWQVDSFDLWEEVNGQHFFTTVSQLKAVKLGWNYLVHVQPDFDDKSNSFAEVLQDKIQDILSFLMEGGGFLNANKNHIIETPTILGKRSGLDIAVLIGSILTHDDLYKSAGSDNVPFDVEDSGILNSLHGLAKQMEILYPVNHQRANLNLGVALGRYPEDVYDGLGTSEGNPWFLATSAAAEVFYKVIWRYYALEEDLVIPMDSWKSEFWSRIFDKIDFSSENSCEWQLVIPYGSPAFKQTMVSLFTLGDSFLDKVREHVSAEGEMSEQFNKYTGYIQGARHLTWSYGAFWNSCRWRTQVLQKLGSDENEAFW
ncbi:LAME_0G12926g1_1 [Lachancea meyersii CBS 8951]|uniref:glucan 1,4-alpha-glucosidase n=1 Tax=Lachancea meyersii CBS 8951 TaxID=1266667 RepID=A0A1G4K9X3_9SACH|nr:LAME_0G12926g1_1 [Lachancea meyersii CBS 8951]